MGDQQGADALPAAAARRPRGLEREEALSRAVEIRDGVIENPKILSFQGRDAEYPHERR